METIIRLWKIPSTGRLISTISGMVKLHQRQENALHSFAHPAILHWRFSHDGGGIDWIFSVRDAGEMKTG